MAGRISFYSILVLKKLTIITSLYKGESYLDSFLNNIENQTVWDQCHLYIQDADSPDDGFKIIEPFLAKHKNITYERLNNRVGIYESWNSIIKKTESEYLVNANVDDFIYPDFLEKHINLLDSDKDIDLAYCYNINSNVYSMPSDRIGPLWATDEFSLLGMLKLNLVQNHPVWRRSIHDKCGYFNESYSSASDWEMWLRAATLGSKFKLIPEVLGVYYSNPYGMSSNYFNMQQNIKEVQEVYSKYCNIMSFLCKGKSD